MKLIQRSFSVREQKKNRTARERERERERTKKKTTNKIIAKYVNGDRVFLGLRLTCEQQAIAELNKVESNNKKNTVFIQLR